jgi:hypothetical protein
MLAIPVAGQRVEVIPGVNNVHTQRFGLLRGTPDVCVSGMLGVNRNGYSDHGIPIEFDGWKFPWFASTRLRNWGSRACSGRR